MCGSDGEAELAEGRAGWGWQSRDLVGDGDAEDGGLGEGAAHRLAAHGVPHAHEPAPRRRQHACIPLDAVHQNVRCLMPEAIHSRGPPPPPPPPPPSAGRGCGWLQASGI
eukprot:SM000081S22620  [mRNA]  locus=s81:184617:185102:- [translate_table: standard]